MYGRPRQAKVLAVSSGDEEEPRVCQVDRAPSYRTPTCGGGMHPPSKLERRVTNLEELMGNMGKNVGTLVKEVRLLKEQVAFLRPGAAPKQPGQNPSRFAMRAEQQDTWEKIVHAPTPLLTEG